MATSLLDYLKEQGYKADSKRNTLREYNEPTIEFYKSGQARLRGLDGITLDYLVYHTSALGVEIFVCENKEEMEQAAKAMNWNRCATASGKVPNIRMPKASDFYSYIEQNKPEQSKQTQNGGVAWDTLEVDGKRIAWSKEAEA